MGAILLLEKGSLKPLRPPSPAGKNIRWVEGLRGLAAVCVVWHHISMILWPEFQKPAASLTGEWSFWQLPIIRAPWNGHAWVAIFFLLAGYNNALKPIKMARAGETQAAAFGLLSSAFRKTFRFVLPTMCAQVIVWIVAQLGCYELSRRVSGGEGWLDYTTPPPNKGWLQAVKDLVWNFYSVWVSGENVYDKNYWALLPLLKGSFMVYVLLVVTLRCTSRYRMLLCAGMYVYSWMCDDSRLALNIYAGVFLAELSMICPLSNVKSWSSPRAKIRRLLPLLLCLLALLTMGHPSENDAWAPWSRKYRELAPYIFPAGADVHFFWTTLGDQLFVVSIMFSPELQRLFSHPLMVWLGSISFPIYLLHGCIIRTFMIWLLYGWREPVWLYSKDFAGNIEEAWEAIPNPHTWMFPATFAATWALILGASYWFNAIVEPFCAWITKRIEEVTCPRLGEASRVADLQEKGLPKPNGLA